MSNYKAIFFGCFLAVAFFGCSQNQDNKADRPTAPNIVFIMADDHAYQAISAYDGTLNETPNIDRLADEGMRFTRSFVTNSICGPSRAVMLTGKYSHLNGFIDNQVAFDGSQQTFPKLLQKAGYQTAIVGKWHLKSEPTGFDYYNILPGQGHYYNPDFIENGERKRIPGYVTDLTTDFAIKWLEGRNQDKPFCLLVHHKAPHRNWMPAPEYLIKYDDVQFPLPKTFFDDYSTRGSSAKEQELSIEKDMQMAYDVKVPQLYRKTQPETRQRPDSMEWSLIAGRMNEEQRAAWDKAYQQKNDALIMAELNGDDLTRWKYQRYMQDYLSCIASEDDNVG